MKLNTLLARCLMCSPLALLGACGDQSTSAGIEGSSSLTLHVTDAPIDDAVAVVVEFTGVSIKVADQEEPTVIEFEEAKSIDLLALQGASFDTLLDGVEVPAGIYQWVRLHVNAEQDEVMDSYIEFEDGTMKELNIPSGSESGLKIKVDLVVVEGEEAEYTIDFDLRKSLYHSRGDTYARMKPSLRMVNNKRSGHVHGHIHSDIITEACADGEQGAVYVFAGADAVPADYAGLDTDPIASALVKESNEGFRYEVGFLEAGEYTVAYTCDAAIDTAEAVESIMFLSTANVELKARKMGERDMEERGGKHSGRSDGRRGSDGEGEGRFLAGLTEEEREEKQAEWDALTEEEKEAKIAEWRAQRGERGERGGFGLDEMTEEERAEWEAMTDEEREAKRAELAAERDAEKAAEREAERAAEEAEEAETE